MKELLLVVLKYYAIIGGVCAIIAAGWISILSVKADCILNRGNMVKVKIGPTFTPGCNRARMADYFILGLGFGMTVITFFIWPYLLLSLIIRPRQWCMVEEVRTD